jgi:predicted methyltransferase
LAHLVGAAGRVLAFDIQQAALVKTAQRLERALLQERVTLYHADHAVMGERVVEPVQAVMFNLGYLPGADHRIITQPASTFDAVIQATRLLKPGGLITIVIYPGHSGGPEERVAVERAVTALPQQLFTVARYEILNQANNPPLVVAIERLHKAGESV